MKTNATKSALRFLVEQRGDSNRSRDNDDIRSYSFSALLVGWFLLFIITSCRPLFAADNASFDIGSGNPGLHIWYESADRYDIYLNERPPEVSGKNIHSGGYFVDWPKQQKMLSSRGSPTNEESGPFALFPFGDQTAFTCPYGGSGWASDKDAYDPAKYHYWPRMTQVFSASSAKGDCLLESQDVYGLARIQYGLATNQLFLGKIGTNIFYWENRDPSKVYFRSINEKQAVRCFDLPGGVLDVYGVTEPLRHNKDVGIWASRRISRSEHWITIGSPYENNIFEFSFDAAKRVKDGHQLLNQK